MLAIMRKRANSVVVWFIIGAIAVVFIFFGVGPGGGSGWVMRVNGQDVLTADYTNMSGAVSRALMAQGLEQTDDFNAMVKEITAEEIAGLYLVRQFGQSLGLTPTNQAVAQAVAANPQFQIDGRFNSELYKDILQAMRTSPATFEEHQRDELIVVNFTSLVRSLSQVYRPEVLEYYHFQEDQVEFDYAFFPAASHRVGLNPTAEDLGAYFARNGQKWLRPAEMEMEYVLIRPADFTEKVIVSDDELQLYYKENSQRFTQPASAEVSHILIRFPALEPTPAEKVQTQARAMEAFSRATKEDFATVAKEISEDATSSSQGGSLGSLQRGVTFDGFEDAAFSAPLNQVTEPVETPLGYHLIKVTSRREDGIQPFEEVRETLLAERQGTQARNLAVAQLEDLIVRSETSKLAEAASSMGLTIARVTFTEDASPEFFEGDSEALQQAFEAPLGRVAKPMELAKNLILYTPASRQKSQIPPLEEVQAEVSVAWIEDEANQLARKEAADFASQASTTSWAEALKNASSGKEIETGRTPLVSRSTLQSTAPFDMANGPEFSASIFSVAKAGEISPLSVSGQFNDAPGAFALSLLRFEPADEALLDGPMGEVLTSIMSTQKANILYQAWRRDIRSKATVTVPL